VALPWAVREAIAAIGRFPQKEGKREGLGASDTGVVMRLSRGPSVLHSSLGDATALAAFWQGKSFLSIE